MSIWNLECSVGSFRFDQPVVYSVNMFADLKPKLLMQEAKQSSPANAVSMDNTTNRKNAAGRPSDALTPCDCDIVASKMVRASFKKF